MKREGNTINKKALVSVGLKEEQLRRVREILKGYDVRTEVGTTEDLAETEIVIHWNKQIQALWEEGKLPNLHWVQVISAGVNYTPLEEFAKKGILLTNTAGMHSDTIGEHVMAMLLYVTRQIGAMRANQERKKWEQSLPITELNGKTMLIVGAGHIGRRLAEIAKSFRMDTIGVNRSGRSIPQMDESIKQDRIADVLGRSDVIVNILPGTDETEHYFSRDLFAQMKPGTLFINVGRGSTVDTAALLESLDKGIIGFAALDVFEEEPLPGDSPLWEHERVLISPHVAGQLEHFRDSLFPIIEENLLAYTASGEPSVNVIDYAKNY